MIEDTIKQLARDKGIGVRGLYNKLSEMGVYDDSESTFYGLFNRNKTGIPSKLISPIASVLEVPEQYLFTQNINTLKRIIADFKKQNTAEFTAMLPATSEALNNSNYAKILKYEIYAGGGQVGIWDEKLLADSDNFYVIDKRLLPINIQSSHLIMMQIVGDSMEPKYNEGDWVLIEHKNGRPVKYVNGVHIVKYGDTVQIKNVEFLGNGDIRCSSYNQAYAPFQPIKDFGETWDIIGKVCGKLTIGTGFVWE